MGKQTSMKRETVETAWLWPTSDGGVWGLWLDTEEQIVRLGDSVNCACDDHFLAQTFADFLEAGARYGNPPDDVIREVQESIGQLMD
jgi:hypothetical protein